MLEQKCSYSNHQEKILGICLSDKCVNNAIFCYVCFKSFHPEHQKECQTFKILSNQLIHDEEQLKNSVDHVKEFKMKFDELYKKLLEKSQDFIEKLNSINMLIKEKSFYPTDTDIHFLKSYKRSSQINFEQWIATLQWIMTFLKEQIQNQKYYTDQDQDQDQDKTDQQTIDQTQNQKVDTDQDYTDNQTIDQNQKNTDVVVQQGIDLFNNNNFQKALVIFEKLPKSHKEAINWKLQCLMQMKKYHDVVKECDKILQVDTQIFEIYLKKSEALIELKEYSLAIQNIQKGIELNPQGAIQLIQQNINLFNSENLNQLDASNLKDIINQAKQIIHENQSKLQLLNIIEGLPDSLTAQLQQKNQTQSSEESHNLSDDKKQEKQNEIIEIENTFNSCLVQLNQIISDYQDGKKYIEIEQKMHQQLYSNQNYQDEELISVLLQQGDTLFKQQHYEEAIKIFNKIIEMDSKNSIAYRNKAQCLNLLERHEEAMEYSNLSIQIDPVYFGSYLIRGISQLKLNLYEDAINSFQTVIKLDHTQHKAYALKGKLELRIIGQALHNLQRFKEAITQYDLALLIYQDVSYLIKKGRWQNNILADSLFELHEYQDAVTAYEDALLAGTEDADYIYEKLKSIQIN